MKDVFKQMFSGQVQVYELRSVEASLPRLAVANRGTKRLWVNISLPCASCSSCQQRIQTAKESGFKLFNLQDMQPERYNNMVWTELEYPEGKEIESVTKFGIFTKASIQKLSANLEGCLFNYLPPGKNILQAIDEDPVRYAPQK